jgi:hypothetical protein
LEYLNPFPANQVLKYFYISLRMSTLISVSYYFNSAGQNLIQMKLKYLPIVFSSLLLAGDMIAQSVQVIEGGAGKAGLLESTINGDTTETGERVDPLRIYELKADEVYYQHGPIHVINPDGVLTIRGQEGGAKPVIIKQPLNEVPVGENIINSSLTFLNIQYENMQTDSVVPLVAFVINGDNHRLDVEDCLIENCRMILFNAEGVTKGARIILRGNYFRDLNDFSQWWGGRAVECKNAIDSLVIDNNTFTGAGLLFLSQESVIDVAVINHNTIINNHKYPFLNQYWRECYFTNNLFVNANMVGEDYENVATGGQDPDGFLHGIFGVDSIEAMLRIQPKFLTVDNTLTADIDSPGDYIIYAEDNVVTYSAAVLDDYYNGSVDGVWDDAPASYLTWGGMEPPFKVVNVPGIWQNERTEALVADFPNIREENNIIYEMSTEDLGLGTDPLPQAAADIFIQWNRYNWGVPDITAPADYTAYYFGDHDPGTIPGIETENSATGITRISDMIEDFSYTAELTSRCDGLRIGALTWWDALYDPAASLQAIKNRYCCGPSASKPVAATESLFVYPNPANSVLHVNNAKNADITIMNLDGRVVRSKKNVHSINVSDLPNGLYAVTIKEGNRISTQKILIQSR